jgi:hypothetical protein
MKNLIFPLLFLLSLSVAVGLYLHIQSLNKSLIDTWQISTIIYVKDNIINKIEFYNSKNPHAHEKIISYLY